MKKYIQALVLGGLLFLGGATAQALTITSFTPSTITTRVGESVSLPLLLDPQGLQNFSASLRVTYPADLITVTGFDYGGSVIPLSEAGYNTIDNVNGILIKSGGFPGGVTSPTLFGTLRFTAKKSGIGRITVLQGSMALDVNNNNVIDISNSVPAVISVSALPSTGGTSGTVGQNNRPQGTPLASATPSLTGVGGPVDEGAYNLGSTSQNNGTNIDNAAAAAGTATSTGFFSSRAGAVTIGIIILLIIIGIIYSISRTA